MDCRGAFLVGFLWKQRCFSRTLRTYATLFGPLSPCSLPLAAFHFWYSEHTKHRGGIRAAKLARIGIGRLTLELFCPDARGGAGRRLGHRSGGEGRLELFCPDARRQCGAALGSPIWWRRDGSRSSARTRGQCRALCTSPFIAPCTSPFIFRFPVAGAVVSFRCSRTKAIVICRKK